MEFEEDMRWSAKRSDRIELERRVSGERRWIMTKISGGLGRGKVEGHRGIKES